MLMRVKWFVLTVAALWAVDATGAARRRLV